MKNSKPFKIVDIIDYLPHAVVIKSIIKKNTCVLNAVSFDTGEVFMGKVTPFDAFLHIMEGDAEVVIDDQPNFLEIGESIIVPAHSSHHIKAHNRFKMISIVVKHGYEDIVL